VGRRRAAVVAAAVAAAGPVVHDLAVVEEHLRPLRSVLENFALSPRFETSGLKQKNIIIFFQTCPLF
jgi:hypothetical protein